MKRTLALLPVSFALVMGGAVLAGGHVGPADCGPGAVTCGGGKVLPPDPLACWTELKPNLPAERLCGQRAKAVQPAIDFGPYPAADEIALPDPYGHPPAQGSRRHGRR